MVEVVNQDPAIGVPVVEPIAEDVVMRTDDPAKLRQMFIEMGGNPATKTFLAAEDRAQRAAQKRYQSELSVNPYTDAGQKTAKAFLSVAILFVQAIFQYAVPTAFVGLLVAEGVAAYNGFVSIMPWWTAIIYAAVIMLVSTVSMFLRESLLQNAPEDVISYKPTLRLLYDRALYLLGFKELSREVHSESLKMTQQALRLAVWSIVIFGVLGRLKTNADLTSGNLPWTEALQQIIATSNLSTFMEYVGSILLPLAMYVCLHVLVYFIYRSYLLSTGGVDITSDKAFSFLSPPSYNDILAIEMATAYRDMIHLYQANQAKKLITKDSQQQLPEPSPAPTDN